MTASVERIERALERVAVLAFRDPVFRPILERLEADLAKARDREAATVAAFRWVPVEALLA